MPAARIRRPIELSTTAPTTAEEVDHYVHAHRREIERELMCQVHRIEIDRERHYAVVEIPKCHATDMGGCIRVVRRLDPDVNRIDVFAGDEPDTRYEWAGNEWAAFRLSWKK